LIQAAVQGPLRESIDWILDTSALTVPMRSLEGNVGQVVKGLRQTVTKRNLSGSKAKILLSVAAYFHRNRDRMRYND